MALSLNAPIEELKLSNRVRNALHLNGLHTVASLLQCDYKGHLRGFGPGARAELASAVAFNGLRPPASLNPAKIDQVPDEISRLLGQMEASFQKWSARLQHFETRVRELTEMERGHRAAAERHGEQILAAVSSAASEFTTRLTSLRTAGTCLVAATSLPPEQQEMLAIVEEESIQLSLLVRRIVDILPPERAPLCLPAERTSLAGVVVLHERQSAPFENGPSELVGHVQ